MEATDQSATNQSAIKLTFKTSSGMFKSSVMNSETGKPIAVNGIVLQNQNFGAGFFLGTTESGSVLLSPTQ
jgi:glutamate dehydrogenase/leucine dehydrogenase